MPPGMPDLDYAIPDSVLHTEEEVPRKFKSQAKLLLDIEDDVETHQAQLPSTYVFPIVPISREDEQFLKGISVKLQMTDPHMVSVCLTQIQTEVLEDFPAEILLQKPDILKVLNNSL